MSKMRDMSIVKKVNLMVIICGFFLLGVNLLTWMNANHMVRQVDQVYGSNVSMNDLQAEIDDVQNSLEEYLDTKSSTSMEAYYSAAETLSDTVETLNAVPMSSETKLMEKNIRGLAEYYLTTAEATIDAKRSRNVEACRDNYEELLDTYSYMRTCIYTLNNAMFQNNAIQYSTLQKTMHYSEVMNICIMIFLVLFELALLTYSVRQTTKPLTELSKAAGEVANGNFDAPLPQVTSRDEVGEVITAFNKMVENIRTYIEDQKKSMEIQAQLKEKEHEMENSLKDAKLKYLQAQIHPHFLFNCLNAGAQLAMLENAKRTYDYTQNMAEFFRYNLKNMDEVTLQEELEVIDHYIYILNVRYGGEIHYEKTIDESVTDLRMPGMILEPIVENSVNYGISGLDREKKITLEVSTLEDMVYISIKDNGNGIAQEKIDAIMRGEGSKSDSKSSNGVGLVNVINRLKYYYNLDEVMFINSLGPGIGTEVIICLPYNGNRSEESC